MTNPTPVGEVDPGEGCMLAVRGRSDAFGDRRPSAPTSTCAGNAISDPPRTCPTTPLTRSPDRNTSLTEKSSMSSTPHSTAASTSSASNGHGPPVTRLARTVAHDVSSPPVPSARSHERAPGPRSRCVESHLQPERSTRRQSDSAQPAVGARPRAARASNDRRVLCSKPRTTRRCLPAPRPLARHLGNSAGRDRHP